MGTAREPVAGSGVWPAWTARVANCCFFSSDILTLLLIVRSGRMAFQGPVLQIRPEVKTTANGKRPESFEDPGRLVQDRLRLAHSRLKLQTDRPARPTHTH